MSCRQQRPWFLEDASVLLDEHPLQVHPDTKLHAHLSRTYRDFEVAEARTPQSHFCPWGTQRQMRLTCSSQSQLCCSAQRAICGAKTVPGRGAVSPRGHFPPLSPNFDLSKSCSTPSSLLDPALATPESPFGAALPRPRRVFLGSRQPPCWAPEHCLESVRAAGSSSPRAAPNVVLNVEVGAMFRLLLCAVNNPKRHVVSNTSSSFLITV